MSFHPLSAVRSRLALGRGEVSQRDEFRYWLGAGLIGLAYSYQWGYFGLQLNWFLVYDAAVFIAILAIGLSEAYKANGGDEGTDFIKRLAVLGLPLGLVVLAASQLIYWAGWHGFARLFAQGSFRDPARAWQIFMFIFTAGLQTWFWWRMARHLAALNGK